MKKHETGQGLVEYTLVLVLVAIAALMMMISQYFGGLDDQINDIYCQIAESLDLGLEACQEAGALKTHREIISMLLIRLS